MVTIKALRVRCSMLPNGEFDYYIARSVSLPVIKVYVDMNSASQFSVRAALVSASGRGFGSTL